jgi:hypothetical protein
VEVGPFGKELPRQSVEAFVGAAFPSMVRPREVDVELRLSGDLLMPRELLAVVERRRATQARRKRRELSRCRTGYVASLQSLNFGDEREAALAFNQRDESPSSPRADDRVSFPVAESFALINDGWPTGDLGPRWQFAASFRRVSSSTKAQQRLPMFAIGAVRDPAIDRRVRYTASRIAPMVAAQAPGDLFWRFVLATTTAPGRFARRRSIVRHPSFAVDVVVARGLFVGQCGANKSRPCLGHRCDHRSAPVPGRSLIDAAPTAGQSRPSITAARETVPSVPVPKK